MNILVTGNMGYVGPVVASHLRSRWPTARLIGFDTGYFSHCLTGGERLPETVLDEQWFGDMRQFPRERLAGLDAIVHLAAISNDPMGHSYAAMTLDINHHASVRLAEHAKAAGVKAFVFASSCSVYGASGPEARNESSPLEPLTAYAKSKVLTEEALQSLAGTGFTVTALRFATACGMSPRLRLDLVLNDFVASACTTGKITLLSDGSPWRPLIHVADMARAIEWAIAREPATPYFVCNAGSNEWNYQIKALAHGVAAAMPGVEVSLNPAAAPDRRSYRVSFDRFQQAAPHHQPAMTLAATVEDLRGGLVAMKFADAQFRQSGLIRLHTLARLRERGLLNEHLQWTPLGPPASP